MMTALHSSDNCIKDHYDCDIPSRFPCCYAFKTKKYCRTKFQWKKRRNLENVSTKVKSISIMKNCIEIYKNIVRNKGIRCLNKSGVVNP